MIFYRHDILNLFLWKMFRNWCDVWLIFQSFQMFINCFIRLNFFNVHCVSLISLTSFSFSNFSSNGWIGSIGLGGGIDIFFFDFLVFTNEQGGQVLFIVNFLTLWIGGISFSNFNLPFLPNRPALGVVLQILSWPLWVWYSLLLTYAPVTLFQSLTSNFILRLRGAGTTCLRAAWPTPEPSRPCVVWLWVTWLAVAWLLSHGSSSWKSNGIRSMSEISAIPGIFSSSFISFAIGCIEVGLPMSSISLSIDPIGFGHASEIVSIGGILVGCGKLFGCANEYVVKFFIPFVAFLTTDTPLVTFFSFTTEYKFVLEGALLTASNFRPLSFVEGTVEFWCMKT